MKQILISIVGFIFLFSCASPEKLLEKGKFDKLLSRAFRKIEKNNGLIKEKWLDPAHIAFNRMQFDDSMRIAYLIQNSTELRSYQEILAIASEIDKRQDLLTKYGTIRDEYGRQRQFILLPARKWIQFADENISSFYYQRGLDELTKARESNSKLLARRAYNFFKNVNNSNGMFVNHEQYLQEAKEMATVFIQVRQGFFSIFSPIEFRQIFELSAGELIKYAFPPQSFPHADFYLDIRDSDISVLPYNEDVDEHWHEKKILDRIEKEQVFNKEDSTWGVREKKIYKIIRVKVIEVEQYQNAMGRISFSILSLNGSMLRRETLNAESEFRNSFTVFEGDERALNSCDNIKGSRESPPLPYSFESIIEEQLQSQLRTYLGRLDWWDLLST